MGGAERVGWWITSDVRWDQSHLIPLLSHQAPKSYFASSANILILSSLSGMFGFDLAIFVLTIVMVSF